MNVTTGVTAVLSEEHQVVLKQLVRFEEALDKQEESGIRETLRFFDERIVLHRRKEEEALFPVVGRYIGLEHGPIGCMLSEHREEKQMIEEIREALTLWPEHAAWQKIAKAGYGILNLLRSHISKEDQILFPLSEEVLSPEEKAKIQEAFDDIGYCR